MNIYNKLTHAALKIVNVFWFYYQQLLFGSCDVRAVGIIFIFKFLDEGKFSFSSSGFSHTSDISRCSNVEGMLS